MSAAFARDDMCGLMRQDLVTRPAMHQGRRDIAHRAGRHEYGRLLAEQIGYAFAELVHGGIVTDLLVPDFRPRNGVTHPWRRPRLGVREQVDAYRCCARITWGRGVVHGHPLEALAAILQAALAGSVFARSYRKRPRQKPGP